MTSLFTLFIINCMARFIVLNYYSTNQKLKQTTSFFSIFLDLLGLITVICKKILKILLIGISFPILVCIFISDPNQFYSHFGIDPEIIRNLPSIPATQNHCILCVICAQDIQLGEDIIILNCPGRHYFHANCIKSWLNVKLTCPVCRSDNIL